MRELVVKRRALALLLIGALLTGAPVHAAVELLGATDDRLDLGDIAFSDRTALTIALTIKPSAITDGARLISQWGTAIVTEGAFILQITDSDELGFAIADNAGIFSRKTSGLNLVAGTTYRICVKWRGNDASSDEIQIFVNGAEQGGLLSFAGDNNGVSFTDATTSVQIGHETDEAIDGVDGEYSEIAIWSTYLADGHCLAYTKGASPDFFRAYSGVLYVPAIREAYEKWGGRTVTLGSNGSGVFTRTAHPSMFYTAGPRYSRTGVPAAPVGQSKFPGGGFFGPGRIN